MHHIKDPWQAKITNVSFIQKEWLTSKESLTQRIKLRCRKFSVQKLMQGLSALNTDEAQFLNLPQKNLAHVREVYLYCENTPVIFARTVLNRNNLRGPWRYLTKIGSRPLGAALFANPRVRRDSLHFCKVNSHHPLYRDAIKRIKNPPSSLWARRSAFFLNGIPILVTEVFLPDVFRLQQ
jgi:chorismate--pyruvate lyase